MMFAPSLFRPQNGRPGADRATAAAPQPTGGCQRETGWVSDMTGHSRRDHKWTLVQITIGSMNDPVKVGRRQFEELAEADGIPEASLARSGRGSTYQPRLPALTPSVGGYSWFEAGLASSMTTVLVLRADGSRAGSGAAHRPVR
jgi:hypothetical protein